MSSRCRYIIVHACDNGCTTQVSASIQPTPTRRRPAEGESLLPSQLRGYTHTYIPCTHQHYVMPSVCRVAYRTPHMHTVDRPVATIHHPTIHVHIPCEAYVVAEMKKQGWPMDDIDYWFRNRRDGEPPSDCEPVVDGATGEPPGIVAYAPHTCIHIRTLYRSIDPCTVTDQCVSHLPQANGSGATTATHPTQAVHHRREVEGVIPPCRISVCKPHNHTQPLYSVYDTQ